MQYTAKQRVCQWNVEFSTHTFFPGVRYYGLHCFDPDSGYGKKLPAFLLRRITKQEDHTDGDPESVSS
jgi:hypothetical protein